MNSRYHDAVMRRVEYATPTQRTRDRQDAVKAVCRRITPGEVIELLDLVFRGNHGAFATRVRRCVEETDSTGQGDIGPAELRLVAYLAGVELLSRLTRSGRVLALGVISVAGTAGRLPGPFGALLPLAQKRLARENHAVSGKDELLEGLEQLAEMLDAIAGPRVKGDRETVAEQAKRQLSRIRMGFETMEVASVVAAWSGKLRERNLSTLEDVDREVFHVLNVLNGGAIGLDELFSAIHDAFPSDASIDLVPIDQVKLRSSEMEDASILWLCPVHTTLGGQRPGTASAAGSARPRRLAEQLLVESLLLRSVTSGGGSE